MHNITHKNLSSLLKKYWSIKVCTKIAYICLFLFFLIFSPAFYNIREKRLLFDIDKETLLILLAVSLVFIVNIIGFIRKRHDSKILNTALSEYVSKDIARELLSRKGEINLNGEKKKVSIFFSDIEGFTSLSEHFSAEALVCFLKEYLTIMSSNIQEHNGYIDKYEGDCIMALWGAFHSMQKDSLDACLAAIKQKKALKILNIKFKKAFGHEVKIRMGINTGEAVLGNIGASGKKIEYTALGDSVNIASRLESVNKFYNTSICVSEHIYNECVDFFEFREIDTIILKGKQSGLRIYELIDEKGKVCPSQLNIFARYELGLQKYYIGQYTEALQIFTSIEKQDPPSVIMRKRCQRFLKQAPSKNWDHIWRMEQK